MKKRKNFVVCILCAALTLSVCSCSVKEKEAQSSESVGTGNDENYEKEIYIPKEKITMKESNALIINQSNPLLEKLHRMTDDFSKSVTWLFVGDSITANDGNSAEEFSSYPEIFQKYLINDLDRLYDKVINTAVSGWKIADIRYEVSIEPYSPDVVFVAIGTNDSFASDADAELFVTRVSALLEKIAEGGAIPVLIASGSFSDNWGDVNQKNHFAKRYYPSITVIREALNPLFIDFYTVYEENREHSASYYYCSDTIHPSRNGFLVMAQTLITDLGLSVAGSSVLNQNSDELNKEELLPDTLGVWLKASDYIREGKAYKAILRASSNGFCLAGGSSAVGQSASYITRRSIAQLLDRNLKNDRTAVFYGSLSEIGAFLSNTEDRKPVLVMPEAYGASGRNLIGADGAEQELSALLASASASKKNILLITPPSGGSESRTDTANDRLAECMRTLAEEKDITLIDLNAYCRDMIAAEPELGTRLFDENGILNYAGASEAAVLIAEALDMDSTFFSSKTFRESFDPDDWGKQGVNHFYYMYFHGQTEMYKELSYIAPSGAQTANRNTFSVEGKNTALFVGQSVFGVLPGASAVKAFCAPISGEVSVTVLMKSHSTDDSLSLCVKRGDSPIEIEEDKTSVPFTVNYGAYKSYTFRTSLEKGEYLYFIASSNIAERGYMLERITYISRIG
mgnify:CR=1 FL=1